MRKRKDILLIVVCILFLVFPHHAGAEENFSPVTNSGKKWRIGYFQGHEYYEYSELMRGLVQSLIILGWVESCALPSEEEVEEVKALWIWLSKNIKSDYIEFVDDAFWSSEKEKGSCDANKENIYERAVKEKYIDLMISMGTYAGECLSKEVKEYKVKTMVMCASNPVLSNIVKSPDKYPKSPEYSGKDHIHAIIIKDEFPNEIYLFHRLVNFKKLGIVYEDTDQDRVKSAVQDAIQISKEHGFELKQEKIPKECSEEKCRKEELVKKYNKLAKEDGVDAMYITKHMEESENNIELLKKLLLPMFKHNVATWSQTPRSWMVKYGVLMSLDGADPADIGMFEAKVMAQILRGKKPGEISQLFVNPKNESITLNLETAQKIQLDLSWDALATAEKIYEKIEDSPAKDEEQNNDK